MIGFASRFDALHDAAARAVGQDDFGGTDYHEGMRALLDALDEGAALSEAAAHSASGLIVGALAGRLATQAGWNANPEARGRSIPAPLVVIGVPRTGTTALHQLLSLDPQFQGFEHWLTVTPMVRPPRETWDAHPAFQASAKRLAQFRALAPTIMAAHGLEADQVDECLTPMAQSFVSNWFPSQLDVPDYDAWFRVHDERPSFARYADVLGLVGLGEQRRWLLKNPSHLFGIDALLAVFPDACVIQTHRNPVRSIASLTSLLGGLRELLAGGPVDRARIQAREVDFWAEATRRGMAAQDRRPERFANVMQDDIRRDPLGVVERIYDRFSLTLSPAAEANMRAWAAANPPEAESAHHYTAVANADEIAAAFAPYIERYGLEGVVG